MERPTDEQIAALKRTHGDDLTLVPFDKKPGAGKREYGAYFIVRGPSPDEYQRFTDRASEGNKQRIDAMDELARACVVYPDEKEALAFYLRKPAATTALAGHVLELAGISEERSEKLLPPCSEKRRATTSSLRAR